MLDQKYLTRIEASMRLDIDLYRSGNTSTPRFDNVRDVDIVKYKSAAGETGTGITHYAIRPSADMLLSAYVAQMQTLAGVDKLELEEAIEVAGRWSKA